MNTQFKIGSSIICRHRNYFRRQGIIGEISTDGNRRQKYKLRLVDPDEEVWVAPNQVWPGDDPNASSSEDDSDDESDDDEEEEVEGNAGVAGAAYIQEVLADNAANLETAQNQNIEAAVIVGGAGGQTQGAKSRKAKGGGKAVAAPTMDELLTPNGHKWEVVGDPQSITNDPSRERFRNCKFNRGIMELNFPIDKVMDHISYFKLHYPMQGIDDLIEATNLAIAEGKSKSIQNSTTEEFFAFNKYWFFKFIGIIMTKALTVVHGGIGYCWSTEELKDTVFEAGNFNKKYGMTRAHFQMIVKYLTLSSIND